ncbi:MAG: thioredoxin domain-containing protein [Deltaproteobacteria bacterium]|nr:thioredoxin domain-containing protein [Deltaproteobacteria bacterium]
MNGLNRLGREKSPYLLQHKNNPVHWYAWGDEAFEAAREQNKLIFLSIGYSTCHWCHVMEHDSFEKEEVADLLNKHFISIKVDREERPDLDQIYMEAVMGMTGSGGWPMSVFLTPDLKPFYGGTFFWRPQFLQLLAGLQKMWETDPEKIRTSGREIADYLSDKPKRALQGKLGENTLRQAFSLYSTSIDGVYGGFGHAPKFPRSTDLSLLLRIHRRTGSTEALAMVEVTLDNMARGGIYDHLGGGFHRYSTDAEWLTPHFEKMLYDNALLAWTYLEAYQVTQKPMYASVARETLDYILRDMTSPDGGFYSAEDADSEGVEGKFYCWMEDELEKVLTPEEFEKIKNIYGVSHDGNFEHGMNILHLLRKYDWPVKDDPLIKSAHRKLFDIREKRIHPLKDDKILTDLNGLMIFSQALGYQVLGDEKYLKAAQGAARFIGKKLYRNGALLHRYRDGEAGINGFVNDYAFFIHGLIGLFESDFDPKWLLLAEELQGKQDELFWDSREGGYFFTAANQADLIVRKKEMHDGACPSGNSVSALNLLRFSGLTFNTGYWDKGEGIFAALAGDVGRYPAGYSMTLIALDYLLDASKEIAIIGPSSREAMAYLYRTFLPNKVLAMSVGPVNDIPLLKGREAIDGKATFYVCENQTCRLPTNDIEAAKKIILDFKKYDL